MEDARRDEEGCETEDAKGDEHRCADVEQPEVVLLARPAAGAQGVGVHRHERDVNRATEDAGGDQSAAQSVGNHGNQSGGGGPGSIGTTNTDATNARTTAETITFAPSSAIE